jgi:hypothetical protein
MNRVITTEQERVWPACSTCWCQHSTRIETVLNRKTKKALGLEVPLKVAVVAYYVIE